MSSAKEMETPPFGMDLNVFSTSHIFLAYKKGFSSDGGYKIKPGGSFKALIAHSPSRASALWPWPYTNVGQVGKRVEALEGDWRSCALLGRDDIYQCSQHEAFLLLTLSQGLLALPVTKWQARSLWGEWTNVVSNMQYGEKPIMPFIPHPPSTSTTSHHLRLWVKLIVLYQPFVAD